MALLGTAAIYLTLLLAVWAGALAVVGARRRQAALVDGAVTAVYAVAAVTTLAMLAMVYSFVVSDFSLSYVHQHSDRTMPLFYRITGVWGGMAGSMLLWVWLQALVSAAAVRANRRRLPELLPYAIAVLMTVVSFFAVLMIVASDPFARYLMELPVLGKGMNPLLQNPYMVTHPPSLYLGFVGLSVPFALGMGALLSGQVDDSWIHASRPWALLSWFFLSLGLTLGMLWAYEELGWGGYWGWDPVENAGFMPWLICTAYLHSIMVQERRQMLKSWNVILATLGFVMTIFGTFLTRSGFIDSVHAFARSNIGYVFLGFIGIVLLFSFSLIFSRRVLLRSRADLESVLSREFWFLLNNWVLLSAALLVMVLTTFPNLSELFGEKVTISIPAFNRWMVPIGLVLLLITAIGPMLGWRKTSSSSLRAQFLWPLAFAIAVVGTLAALGATAPQALVAWSLCAFVLGTIAQELTRATLLRAKAAKINVLSAFFGLFARNRRRYGGYVVHVGIVLMCIGFAGEAFKLEKEVQMRSGQRFTIGQYTLRFDGLETTRDAQKQMLTAPLTLFIEGRAIAVLQPGRWVYDRHEKQPTTEVSIRRSIREDLYVAIGNFDLAQQRATFKFVVNPLVNWIWIGFLVMAIGTIIAGMPMRMPGRRTATVAAMLLAIALPAAAHANPPAVNPSTGSGHAAAGAPAPSAHKEGDGPVLLTSDGPRERKLFSGISCMCEGCPKIPLESCNCGFAQQERGAIRAKIRGGWSDTKIITWYTKYRGPEVGKKVWGATALAIPPDTAFNRLAWLLPYGLSAFAAAFLLMLGLRWKRNRVNAPAALPLPTTRPDGTEDPYDALLDDELKKLD